MEWKHVTAVKLWYTRKYENPSPSTNYLRQWHQEFQERGVVGHRPRSGRPGISDTDVARIKYGFEDYPRKSLKVANIEPEIRFRATQNVSHEKLRMFSYEIGFIQQLLSEDFLRRLPCA